FVREKKADSLPDHIMHDVLEDHNGDIWLATIECGLFQLTNAERDAPTIKRTFDGMNGLPSNWVFDLLESSDHNLWVGSNHGLIELPLNNPNEVSKLRVYTTHNAFIYHEIANMAED